MQRILTLLVALLWLTVAACSDERVSPTEPEAYIAPTPCEVDGTCSGGSGPPSNGIKMMSWTQCLNAVTDADRDGIDDTCEYQAAYGFRPELKFSNGEIRRAHNPYWAVRRCANCSNSNSLQIFYAIGYHHDILHVGDSEFIMLSVHYSSGTGRWYLDKALLSAHYGTPANRTRNFAFDDLEFRDAYRGRPYVYPALGKHANYPSRASCNALADIAPDYCMGPYTYVHLHVGAARNIGNNQSAANRKLLDCVTYDASNYYNGVECLWTGSTFAGWTGQSVSTMGYGSILRDLGWVQQLSGPTPCEEPLPDHVVPATDPTRTIAGYMMPC